MQQLVSDYQRLIPAHKRNKTWQERKFSELKIIRSIHTGQLRPGVLATEISGVGSGIISTFTFLDLRKRLLNHRLTEFKALTIISPYSKIPEYLTIEPFQLPIQTGLT